MTIGGDDVFAGLRIEKHLIHADCRYRRKTLCLKMEFRPGGMDFLDSEDDDDDLYVSTESYDRSRTQNKSYQSNGTKKPVTYNHSVSHYDEQKKLESHVIKACQYGHLNVVQDYLKRNIVNDYLSSGWTLLLYAASYGQLNILKYLLECGADPNIHRDGYTPLLALCNSTSAKDTDLECLLLLIKAGANANATSKQRETCVMYACKTKEPAFLEELLKHVNNINMYDGSSQTALMYAVFANRPEIVKILLDNEADQTLQDNNNLCAIDIATEKRYNKIVELLDPNRATSIDDYNTNYIQPTWRDMFPTLSQKNKDTCNFEVSTMLWGMGLAKYTNCFNGVDLKTFLQLTDQDLIKLGVDINAHRKQFSRDLHRFFGRKWLARSIGNVDKSLPYTIYDGLITLGTVTKHTIIIDSSLVHLKQNLTKAYEENLVLNDEDIVVWQEKLQEMKQYYNNLRKELLKLQTLAEKIKRETDLKIPALYIGPKQHKPKWTLILSLVITVGMTLSKTSYVQRLFHNLDWKIVRLF